MNDRNRKLGPSADFVPPNQAEILKYLLDEHPLLLRDEYVKSMRGLQNATPEQEADRKLMEELETKLCLEDTARCPVVQVIATDADIAAYWGHRKLRLEEDPGVRYGVVMSVLDAPRFFTLTEAVRHHLHGDTKSADYSRAVGIMADYALDILRVGDDAHDFLTGITKIGTFTHSPDEEADADDA